MQYPVVRYAACLPADISPSLISPGTTDYLMESLKGIGGRKEERMLHLFILPSR